MNFVKEPAYAKIWVVAEQEKITEKKLHLNLLIVSGHLQHNHSVCLCT